MSATVIPPVVGGPEEADRHAARLIADEPALAGSPDFGPFVAQGDGIGPRILIGDQSAIPMLARPVPPVLDHRMAMLARDGDTIVLAAPDAAFFEYLRDVLGRMGARTLAAGTDEMGPVARRCREAGPLRHRLEVMVRKGRGATIQSYITTGHDWRLAQALGKATGTLVHVAGPAPRIARRANDKLWFAALARRVLGCDAVPPTMGAYGPAASAALIRRIARAGDEVIVKVPDSAGSAGNIRLDADRVAGLPLPTIRRFLRRQLAARGWSGHYPLLVGVWDPGVTCSPSVQMWLPRPEDGPPRSDGIFEQRVQGTNAEFVGGVRSSLPVVVRAALERDALRIAAVLQRLGYYGRCSLDAVLVQDAAGAAHRHWIECNGRWGGVSIPMQAATSFLGGVAPTGLVVAQTWIDGPAVTMADLRDALGPVLWRPGAAEGTVIVAPPRPGSAGTLLTLMAMAPTQTRAEQTMEGALARCAAAG